MLSNTGDKVNYLNPKHRNRYRILRGMDMTYILGARCADGVVLVGDTKVTIDEGADYAYSKKIFRPFTSVVMGSAGISGLFKSFQDRMIYAVTKLEETEKIDRVEKFSVLTENVIRDMHDLYGEDSYVLRELSVLMVLRIGPQAELRHFTPIGFPEPVNECKAIGHGEPYGAIFLKKMWKPTMSMEQAALLGCFVLKSIQENKIDNSVGYSSDYPPQIWYIPDVQIPPKIIIPSNVTEAQYWDKIYSKFPIRELAPEEVQSLLNRISKQVEDFNSFFVHGEFKLF